MKPVEQGKYLAETILGGTSGFLDIDKAQRSRFCPIINMTSRSDYRKSDVWGNDYLDDSPNLPARRVGGGGGKIKLLPCKTDGSPRRDILC